VDLLLSDVVLPGGMNGPELAERARQNDPALKVLFMSGYAETAFQSRDRFRGDAAMLKKPFRKRELAQRIRSALDGGTA
jgi:CheY-like chemotaxis protein